MVKRPKHQLLLSDPWGELIQHHSHGSTEAQAPVVPLLGRMGCGSRSFVDTQLSDIATWSSQVPDHRQSSQALPEDRLDQLAESLVEEETLLSW